MANRWETMEIWETLFWRAPKSLQMMTAAMRLKDTCTLEEKLWQTWTARWNADKGPSSQSYGFSSSHVWMWELDHKESWVPKNWWFWTVVLQKTLESLLDCKEIQPVCPKGNQSWIVLPMHNQDWSPLGWPGWISLQSKGVSRVFSNTTVQKHPFFGAQLSL